MDRRVLDHDFKPTSARPRRRVSLSPPLGPPYSGHASRTSLEIYSLGALADAQHSYDKVIERLPV